MWNPVRSIFQEVGAFLMPPPAVDDEELDSPNYQSEINGKKLWENIKEIFPHFSHPAGILGANACLRGRPNGPIWEHSSETAEEWRTNDMQTVAATNEGQKERIL